MKWIMIVYDSLNDDESPNDDSPCVTTPVTVSPQQVEQRSSIKKPFYQKT